MGDRKSYADGPYYPELVAVVVAGALHVVLELTVSEPVAWAFNAVVVLVGLGYLGWRGRQGSEVWRAWGMRRDNFAVALRRQLRFGLPAGAGLVAYGLVAEASGVPWTFWLTVALYPVWGIAQQFALQNLVARHVAGLVPGPTAVAGVSALLFGAAHYPRWPLVLLTIGSGFFFTRLYRQVPNLWAVGLVHGVLGTVAVYFVLGEDPGAAIWRSLLQEAG